MTGITMAIGKKLPLYLRKPTFPDQRWYHLSADGKRSYGDKLRATRPPSRAGCSVYKKNSVYGYSPQAEETAERPRAERLRGTADYTERPSADRSHDRSAYRWAPESAEDAGGSSS